MDSHWLNTQFKINPEKSKADLARSLGLDPPAISKILSGTRQIKAQEYLKMRAFFGMGGGDAFLQNTLQMHNNVLPVSSRNNVAHMAENNASQTDWEIPRALNRNIRASVRDDFPLYIALFRISDDMMSPDFLLDECVLVDKGDKIIKSPGAYIISDGYGFMARYCAPMINENGESDIVVSACNQYFEPQTLTGEDIIIMGRIIGKMQPL